MSVSSLSLSAASLSGEEHSTAYCDPLQTSRCGWSQEYNSIKSRNSSRGWGSGRSQTIRRRGAEIVSGDRASTSTSGEGVFQLLNFVPLTSPSSPPDGPSLSDPARGEGDSEELLDSGRVHAHHQEEPGGHQEQTHRDRPLSESSPPRPAIPLSLSLLRS